MTLDMAIPELKPRNAMPSPVAAICKLYNFKPHSKKQWDILHCPAREISILAGIQWGKSQMGAAITTVWRILVKKQRQRDNDDRPIIVWLVSDKYENSDREYVYLEALFRHTDELAFASQASRQKAREIILKDGTNIRTLTSTDITNIGRERPDIIVGCEAAQLGVDVVDRLRARRGVGKGYLILTGTLESSFGWYAQLHRQWARDTTGTYAGFFAPTWENSIIFPGGRNDPAILKIEQDLPRRVFLERYAAEVQTPPRYVFGDTFNPDLHVAPPDSDKAAFREDEPVHLGIDPGYEHAHAVVAVQHPKGEHIRVIDEVYEKAWSIQRMIEEVKLRPWFKNVELAVIDFAGTQHKNSAETPPMQIWRNLCPDIEVRTTLTLNGRPGAVPVMAGVHKLWQLFEPTVIAGQLLPRIVISSDCHGLLSEVGYEVSPLTGHENVYSWSMNSDGDLLTDVPKDLYNDGIKALTYLEIATEGYVSGGLMNRREQDMVTAGSRVRVDSARGRYR